MSVYLFKIHLDKGKDNEGVIPLKYQVCDDHLSLLMLKYQVSSQGEFK